MECKGRVERGVVVLDGDAPFEDGTVVRVQAVEDADLPLLADLFESVAGKAVNLPSDLAENHDHYLHGLPKKPSG